MAEGVNGGSPRFGVQTILKSARSWLVLILVVALFSINSTFRHTFFTQDYLPNIFEQSARNIVLAVGMSFVIFTGGIDLSVGSVLALCGVGLALSLGGQLPEWMVFVAVSPLAAAVAVWAYACSRRHSNSFRAIACFIAGAVAELAGGSLVAHCVHGGTRLEGAIVICVMIGVACGLVNGLTSSLGRVPPFVVTLGMMSAARGLTLYATDGASVSARDYPRLLALGQPQVLVIAPLIVVLCGAAIIKWMKTGRYILSIGGNEQASRLSGINVAGNKTLAYILAGICAAIGAILVTAMFGQASTNAASGAELEAIASVVIGGASLTGGRGSIVGAMVGALTITVITAGLILVQVPDTLQQVVLGAVIVATVLVDQAKKRA